MKLLVWIMCGLVPWAIIIGLWDHSWQLISAGVLVAIIWPLNVEAVSPPKGKGSS